MIEQNKAQPFFAKQRGQLQLNSRKQNI